MSATQPAKRTAVWALPVAAGGCGACAQSVLALQAPQYDAEMHTQRVRFAASPRHADVVLITGPVPVDTLEGLQAYIEAVPQPRALIAVGDCAIDGGVFRGSPDIVPNLAEALDVHVEIAGCPPPPGSILAAIAQAAQLLVSADAAEADEETELADAGDDDAVEEAEEPDETDAEALADDEVDARGGEGDEA
jgi:Ni,Fe-hydrogenase III small subunit